MSEYWAMVPEALIRSGLSDRAVRVYALLQRHANAKRLAWPRQTRIAAELECSRATVERAVRELREKGWIETKRREAGGVCEYLLHTSPLTPRRTAEPCEPPLTDEGTLPSPVRGHKEPEPVNEKLAAQAPPRAAVGARRAAARERARREDALDPELALGIWDKPAADASACARFAPAPARTRRRVDGDSPMGLALAWREVMREAGIAGALDANLKALASHFKAMIEMRVTPSQIRAITRLYATKPGLRNAAASPWRDFLHQRSLLLASVSDAERYQVAAANPAQAWLAPPAAGSQPSASRYAEDLARHLARR